MDSVLRPRDIQARIRSGESPETVAAAAQTTVEKIMPFAQPVLAERAYVAQQAQRASVRRRAGDGAPGQLGTAVAERLTASDLDPEAVEWDAWRRDDGRWTLVAAYDAAGGPERAEFVYDAAGRYVTATDDSSRRLVGERLPGATPAPTAETVPATPSEAGRDQLHLGDDAIELVTGRRPEPPAEPATPLRPAAPVDEEPTEHVAAETEEPTQLTRPMSATAPAEDRDEVTVDLTEPASAVRRVRPVADPDWMATQASERPPAPEAEALFEVPAPEAAPEPAPAGAGDSMEAPDTGSADPVDAEAGTAETAPDSEPSRSKPARTAKTGKTAKGSKGRAAIPSWDEIMFGSSTGD